MPDSSASSGISRLLAADRLHVFEMGCARARAWLWLLFYKLMGSSIAAGPRLYCFGWPRITYARGIIEIGADVMLGHVTLAVAPGRRLVIGDRCTVNNGTVIWVDFGVTIGTGTLIAECVSIRDSNHRVDDLTKPIREQGFVGEPIVIEPDAWIGRGVAVLRGARIGAGAVIGANAVVTRAIPPMSIAVGIPARVVRMRGEERRGVDGAEIR